MRRHQAVTAAAGLMALTATATGCSAAQNAVAGFGTAPTAAPAEAHAAAPGSALQALNALPVKGHAPGRGYSRAQFGPKYSDDVNVPSGHNRCSQLADIRRRDTREATRTGRCGVTGGYIPDPYSGQRITPRDAQLEHVVALKDAWQTGATQLTPQQRADLAGDPLNLLMVTGRLNAAKQESNAASWLPPNKAFRCRYVALQIAVKSKYRLWLAPAEKDQMVRVLSRCPREALPSEADQAVRVPEVPSR